MGFEVFGTVDIELFFCNRIMQIQTLTLWVSLEHHSHIHFLSGRPNSNGRRDNNTLKPAAVFVQRINDHTALYHAWDGGKCNNFKRRYSVPELGVDTRLAESNISKLFTVHIIAERREKGPDSLVEGDTSISEFVSGEMSDGKQTNWNLSA